MELQKYKQMENKELTFVIKDNEGEEFGKLGLHPREVGVSIS